MQKLNYNQPSRSVSKSDFLKIITPILRDLIERGMFQRFDSECIAAADILQHALDSHGITSRIVECQLAIVSTSDSMRWNFVGWNQNNYAVQGVDTHVVVVTEGLEPWLLDLSIARSIGGDRPWIIEPLGDTGTDVIMAKYEVEGLKLTYHPKQSPRILALHQKTLLDRLRSETIMNRKIWWVGAIALGSLLFSMLNTAFNIVIYLQTGL